MIKEKSFWAPVKPNKRIKPTHLFGYKINPSPRSNFDIKPRAPVTPVSFGNSRMYIQPVKLSIYPKRTLFEIKLIDKKPFGDKDKDKVPNYFDCKPLDKKKQDFGKFKYKIRPNREVESFTATERFGGANIKKLKKIGAGRDRIVYQLDKDKVLKIAKNPAGLRQNILESDLGGYLEQIKHYETGKDYVVMEKASPLSLKSAQKLSELRAKADKLKLEAVQKKAKFGSSETVENIHKDAERKVIEELNPDFLNYDVSYGDIMKPSSWGEKNGKLVLIDAGALDEERIVGEHKIGRIRERLKRAYQQKEEARQSKNSDFYKERLPQINKDIAGMETEIKDWDEIQRERRKFKSKGKEEKKKIHPYAFQDTHQERIIHSSWKRGNTYAHVLEGAGDVFRESAIHLDGKPAWVHPSYINEKLERIKRHIEDVERMKREKVWEQDYDLYKKKLEDPNAGIQMIFDPKRTESFRHWKNLAEKGIKTGIHPEDSYEAAIEAHPEKINKMIKQWRKQPVQTKLQEKARQLNIAMLKKDFEKAKKIIPQIETAIKSPRTSMEPLGQKSIVTEALVNFDASPEMRESINLAIKNREFEAVSKRVKEEDIKLTEEAQSKKDWIKDISNAQAKDITSKGIMESLRRWDKKAVLGSPKKERKLTDKEYKELIEKSRLDINKIIRERNLAKLKDVKETPKKIQNIIPKNYLEYQTKPKTIPLFIQKVVKEEDKKLAEEDKRFTEKAIKDYENKRFHQKYFKKEDKTEKPEKEEKESKVKEAQDFIDEIDTDAVEDIKDQEPAQDKIEEMIESDTGADDDTVYEGSAQELIDTADDKD